MMDINEKKKLNFIDIFLIICLLLLLVYVAHLTLSYIAPNLYEQEFFSTKGTIILIRHAQDKDDPYNTPRNVTLPNGIKINYIQDRLSTEGKDAANKFVTVISKLVNDLKIPQISKVFVKDPRIQPTTPNPFDTALPFIQQKNIMNVIFAGSPISPSVSIDDISRLISDGGTTLISWDAEGIWGGSGGSRPLHPANNSLIYYLDSLYGIDNSIVPGPPEKGKTIYVYRGDINKLQIYNMNQSNVTYYSYPGWNN